MKKIKKSIRKKSKLIIGCDEFGAFTIRKYFALLFIIFAALHYCPAQTVEFKNGYYQQTAHKDTAHSKPLGANFKAPDGTIYPIYVSEKGKYYVLRTSKKTGSIYKQYLPIQP